MIRYDMFRALAPDDDYPLSLFTAERANVRYDLPLPTAVADSLIVLLSAKGPFRRLDDYCDQDGIAVLRSHPKPFSARLAHGLPAYAESEQHFENDQGDLVLGYILQEAAGNAQAAKAILRVAIEGDSLAPDVAQWIRKTSAFFEHCGGFQIARIRYYVGTDEKDEVSLSVDGVASSTEPKPKAEHPDRFEMFREMLDRTSGNHLHAKQPARQCYLP